MEPAIDLGPEWRTPPQTRDLRPFEAHIWLANLDIDSEQLSELGAVLSQDERERAARFRFDKDRGHYIAGRMFLRHILSSYLEIGPREVRLAYNDYGKPFLSDIAAGNRLEFNVAHSHGLALFGFTRDSDIGVDIERIRPDFATNEIAERFF